MEPLRAIELPEAVRAWLPPEPAFALPEQGTSAWVGFVADAPLVLKRMRGVLESSVAEWEYRALTELAASGLPIPTAIGLHVRQHEGEREAWLCVSRLPGESLQQRLRCEPDVEVRLRWYAAVGEIAARIHDTPIPAALRPEDSPTWFDRVLRRTRRATERVQDLVMRLVRDRPSHAPETLIHGDFTLDNVIVDGDAISGVIDWGGAGPGDPRYDVTLALGPDGETALEPGAAAAFLRGYCAAPISKPLRRFVEQTYGVRAAG
ncbi:MAG: aminoglycoside phosphotransferase family protein [Nannocystaceae bacterium]|nr:aminoglycoside phosphotransferase family protein [Nannocystaceae bacterium]